MISSPESAASKLFNSRALLTIEDEVRLSTTILTKPGTAAAQAAVETLVLSNMRLVSTIARSFTSDPEELGDLTSEGAIGLQKAALRFDPVKKGAKFSTYASWYVRQAITRYLANNGRTIRIPVHQLAKISKVRRISQTLASEFGREPTAAEISDATGINERSVQKILDSSAQTISLESHIGENGTELIDLVADPHGEDPSQLSACFSDVKLLSSLMDCLTDREKNVMTLRFGLNDTEPQSLEAVGVQLNLTRERIRQIQCGALKKLQRRLSKLHKSIDVIASHVTPSPVREIVIPRQIIQPSAIRNGFADFLILDPMSGELCARLIDITRHFKCHPNRLIKSHGSGVIRKHGAFLNFHDTCKFLGENPINSVAPSMIDARRHAVPDGLGNAVIDPNTMRVCARLCDLALWTTRRSTNGPSKLARKYPVRSFCGGLFYDILDVEAAYQQNLIDVKKALVERNKYRERKTKLPLGLPSQNPDSMLNVALLAWSERGFIHLPTGYIDLASVLPSTERGTAIAHIRKLEEILGTIPALQRDIASYRFGVLGRDPHTLLQVAEKLNCTTSYVSQIQRTVVREIKCHF